MQVYRRVEHLFKNRISLNVSPTNRRLFRTFIGLFDLFKHLVGTGATVEFFSVEKLFEEAQNCLEISIAREKNFKRKNFHSSQFFKALSPLIFLRYSEVRFLPFTCQV